MKRYQQTSSLDYWKMERETHDECLRWIIFSFPKVSNLTRTLFFLNPQMSSGVWIPPSWSPTPSAQATTCFSPSPGARSPVSWGQSRCVIIITLEWSWSLSLFQKMSEGEKCCWVCTWCQVMLSLWRIPIFPINTLGITWGFDHLDIVVMILGWIDHRQQFPNSDF